MSDLDSKLGQCVELFKALGEANRARIIEYLGECRQEADSCVSEIKKCCSIDFSVVSRHLSQLKNAGVIEANKKGREVYYSLNAKELSQFFKELSNYFASCEKASLKKST